MFVKLKSGATAHAFIVFVCKFGVFAIKREEEIDVRPASFYPIDYSAIWSMRAILEHPCPFCPLSPTFATEMRDEEAES
jgi:hypothetical protein